MHRRAWLPVLTAVAAAPLLGIADCSSTEPLCSAAPPDGAGRYLCSVPGYDDRAFTLVLPSVPDPARPFPVVLALHGGGGNMEDGETTTCPGGDATDPTCLTALATARGYAVVYPSGAASSATPETRTWNSGGGMGVWQCVSGYACTNGVDDVGYFQALLAELGAAVPVDEARVFSTGLSNGGSMSYRLACELGDRIAAIAPVGAGNQQITSGPCAPPRPVSVLHIHGTDDPCWAYEGGPAACAQTDGLSKISVAQSIVGDGALEGWVSRDGCDGQPSQVALADVADDGTTASEARYQGCDGGAEVVLVTVEGGGHTWPQGWQYSAAETVGTVSQDFSASARMLDFFDAHGQ